MEVTRIKKEFFIVDHTLGVHLEVSRRMVTDLKTLSIVYKNLDKSPGLCQLMADPSVEKILLNFYSKDGESRRRIYTLTKEQEKDLSKKIPLTTELDFMRTVKLADDIGKQLGWS